MTDQTTLHAYVVELARDRGIAPAAALAALRGGPDGDQLGGTEALAHRWGLTVAGVEALAADLDGEPAPAADRIGAAWNQVQADVATGVDPLHGGWRDDATGLISGPMPDVQDCGCPPEQHQAGCPYGLAPETAGAEPEPPPTVRADQLQRGQVVAAPAGGWMEVTAVEPVIGSTPDRPQVTVLWRGGHATQVWADQTWVLADDETAVAWREEQARTAAQRRFATELRQLAARYQRGELPPPTSAARLSVHVAHESDVVAAAEQLGLDPPEFTAHSIRCEREYDYGQPPGGLEIAFHASTGSRS